MFYFFSPLPICYPTFAKAKMVFFSLVCLTTIDAFMCIFCTMHSNQLAYRQDEKNDVERRRRKNRPRDWSNRNINDDIYPPILTCDKRLSQSFLDILETKQYVNLWFLIFVFQSRKFCHFLWSPILCYSLSRFAFTNSFDHNLILKIYFYYSSLSVFLLLQLHYVSMSRSLAGEQLTLNIK